MRGYSTQPLYDIAHVRTKDSTVSVYFVNDHELQIFEELRPIGVARQNSEMKHVRVRQDNACVSSDLSAALLGRIAVIGESPLRRRQLIGFELTDLVLSERFGRKEVNRARFRVFGQRFERRNIITESLARSGGCHDNDVVAAADSVNGVGLMTVELMNALVSERELQRIRQWSPKRAVLRTPCRDFLQMDDLPAVALFASDAVDKFLRLHYILRIAYFLKSYANITFSVKEKELRKSGCITIYSVVYSIVVCV